MTAWLEHASLAPSIVSVAQRLAFLGDRRALQVGKAPEYQSCGFAPGVGVDDVDLFHECPRMVL
ncbi:hypothetical protein GCM10008094_35570 [Aidingimonas halophila]|nr:hypothetical protein GCM10008094_35570 [Aidingimonas halophila]